MRWRLYYEDGTTYEGETPEEGFAAPVKRGAILVKQQADNRMGYTIRRGAYFWCFERIRLSDGTLTDFWRWGGKDDLVGLTQYWLGQEGPQKVIPGLEMDDTAYREICQMADNDGCLCLEPCDHAPPEAKS